MDDRHNFLIRKILPKKEIAVNITFSNSNNIKKGNITSKASPLHLPPTPE